MVLIDKQSRVPAYEQIRNQLLTLILVGTFAPHSQLPSIRSIAADAGVNINTVKKAFSDLESYTGTHTAGNQTDNHGCRQTQCSQAQHFSTG